MTAAPKIQIPSNVFFRHPPRFMKTMLSLHTQAIARQRSFDLGSVKSMFKEPLSAQCEASQPCTYRVVPTSYTTNRVDPRTIMCRTYNYTCRIISYLQTKL